MSEEEINPVRIGETLVGPGHPVYVVAEAGVNHNGDLELAHRMVEVAAEAGADAVKFQAFSADRMVTREADLAAYQKGIVGPSTSQYEMLKRLELTPAAFRELREHAYQRGIHFIVSPFDVESVEGQGSCFTVKLPMRLASVQAYV